MKKMKSNENENFIGVFVTSKGFAYDCFRDDERKCRKPVNKKQYNKAKYYLLNPDLLKEVVSLRKNYSIPNEGFWDFGEFQSWALETFSDNDSLYCQFREDARNLYKVVGEISDWSGFFEYYLLFNENNPYALTPTIQVGLEKDKETGNLNIRTTAKSYATKDDYETARYLAKLMSIELYGETRDVDVEKFDRDAEILQMHFKGMKNQEISKEINKKTLPNEVIDEIYVGTIIKRMKEKITAKNTRKKSVNNS